MDEMAKELKDIFLEANNELLKKDKLKSIRENHMWCFNE